MPKFFVYTGDTREVLDKLAPNSVDVCYTSPNPPFFATINGITNPKVVGTEENSVEYVDNLLEIMGKVHRVLKPTGSLWLNMSEHYYTKTGEVMMIPEGTALTMRGRGWHLMCPCIWHRSPANVRKPNTERLFLRDWEYLYWFAKDVDKYYFNEECDMNKTSMFEFPFVMQDPNKFESGYPIELVNIAIESTCPADPPGTILDPFMGTGATGVAALQKGRIFVGIEIDPEMARLAKEKLENMI